MYMHYFKNKIRSNLVISTYRFLLFDRNLFVYLKLFILAEERLDLHHHISLEGGQEEFLRVTFQAHLQGLRRLHPLPSTLMSQYLHSLTRLLG